MTRSSDDGQEASAGAAPVPAVTRMLGGTPPVIDLDAGTYECDYVGLPTFVNPAGTVQGGMLGAMLDDVTASLVTATLSRGEHCATLNLNLSFLRPALPGTIRGRARLVRRGRGVCHVEGELTQNGKPVATATATCMVVQGKGG
mgnify:CR=1 FL=1